MEFPYAVGVGKIPLLFETIGTKGIPAKVNGKWLEQYGMTSSNDRRLISILRFLGFIDANNAPSEIWREYRGADSRIVLASAIRKSYSELFSAYPDAHDITSQDLTNFVRSNSSLGGEAISKVVSTYRALVGLADFRSPDNTASDTDAIGGQGEASERNSQSGTDTREQAVHPDKLVREARKEVVVNVNLQLTLPESTDPSVYEALFAALNKHMLSDGNSEH
ncbi:MAG TPA: DUF5343 domain-containing protein [Thermomicrobiales bacterium]|nr:DUF5343 domain-containing protein [Thermomicrobiales bacterium]